MIRMIRGAGLVLGAVLGYQIADFVRFEMLRRTGESARLSALGLGIVLGAALGWAVARPLGVWFVRSMSWVLHRLGSVPLRDVLAGAAGLILGLCIAFRVSLPLLRVPIIGLVIALGTLGFLGFGVRPPTPEWGLMISENRSAIFAAPIVVLAPMLALSLLVIGLNFFTDGLARVLGRSVQRGPL